jgi:hypothetical protein
MLRIYWNISKNKFILKWDKRIKISSETTDSTWKRKQEKQRTIIKSIQIQAAGIQNSTDEGYYWYCQWPAKSREMYEGSDNQ